MIFRKSKLFPALLGLTLLTGYACSDSDDDDDDPQPGNPPALNLTGTVAADSNFSTLKAALEKADLIRVLDSGDYTVFAPTNDAFAEVPSQTLNALLNDKPALTKVLLYHVIPGRVEANKVLSTNDLKTANDLSLIVSQDNGAAYVNNSRILKTDVMARNGVVHVIDKVLTPLSLVDVIANDNRFTTLKAAVEAAGLLETLKNSEFTVFAPTNEAFAKLGDATLKTVLANKELLTSILLYHVVPGSVPSSTVLTGAPLATANGKNLTPSAMDGVAKINDAKILQVDVKTTNGIVHIIDTVLVPQ